MNKGVDVGYGWTKVFQNSRSQIFPSVVGNFEENFEVDGLEKTQNFIVELEQNRYLVGESALKYSTRFFQIKNKNWVESIAYRVLLKAALQGEFFNVIVTGLPVSFYKSDKEKVQKILSEISPSHEKKIIPQPLGTFFHALFTENGSVKNEALVQSKIGVVDIGFFTVDMITVEAMELVERQMKSIETGVSFLHESVKKDLENKYEIQISLNKIEEAIRNKFIKIYGEKIDISNIISKRITEFSHEIFAQVRSIWGSCSDLDQIIFSGGGAFFLQNFIKDFARNASIIDNPQFANVRGYAKFANRISN